MLHSWTKKRFTRNGLYSLLYTDSHGPFLCLCSRIKSKISPSLANHSLHINRLHVSIPLFDCLHRPWDYSSTSLFITLALKTQKISKFIIQQLNNKILLNLFRDSAKKVEPLLQLRQLCINLRSSLRRDWNLHS